MTTKGHWVWIDDDTGELMMQACDEVLANAEELPQPAQAMNQLWALWTTIVLCHTEPRDYISQSAEVLIEGLRRQLTSKQFEHCTTSHRMTWPGEWACPPPPSHAGRLVRTDPPEGTSGT